MAKNNARKRFFNFWIFLLFFLEFFPRVEYERNSGLKFFFLFLGLSHPVLAINNAGKMFFNFLSFFFYFFLYFSAYLISFGLKIIPGRGVLIFWIFLLFYLEFSCPSQVWTKFVTKFFFSFSAYLIPFWLKIMPERGFLIFVFFAIFCGIFSPGRVWTEFGSKIFFSLSRPI